MAWSMNSVSFRMAGSGSWKTLLYDKSAELFYSGIYPSGVSLSELNPQRRDLITKWNDSHIVGIQDGKVRPTGPIMTDADLMVLKDWFVEISGSMCRSVSAHIGDYHQLAEHSRQQRFSRLR